VTWATTKEACRLAIAAALDLDDYTGADGAVGGIHKVEWANKQKAVRYLNNDSAWADLRMGAIVAQGTDEIRYEYVAGATAALSRNVPTYAGRRLFSVQVLIGVESQEDAEEAVGTLAGRLRTRLRRVEILAILQDAGVALRSIGPTVDADYRNRDGHWVSASITEIFLARTEQDTDEDNAGDFITETSGTSELTRTDGTTAEGDFEVVYVEPQ
jgi:hypothetical protein